MDFYNDDLKNTLAYDYIAKRIGEDFEFFIRRQNIGKDTPVIIIHQKSSGNHILVNLPEISTDKLNKVETVANLYVMVIQQAKAFLATVGRKI